MIWTSGGVSSEILYFVLIGLLFFFRSLQGKLFPPGSGFVEITFCDSPCVHALPPLFYYVGLLFGIFMNPILTQCTLFPLGVSLIVPDGFPVSPFG